MLALFWPHLAASVVLSFAWLIGRSMGANPPLALDVIPVIPGVAAILLARADHVRRNPAMKRSPVAGAPAVRSEPGSASKRTLRTRSDPDALKSTTGGDS
jgi:hypothetical protein